ncbi:MAG: DinB family protein [Pelobium sp.]
MKSYFLNLLAYDNWANQQVWLSISEKPLINPKIELLFSHLLSAQKIWLNRCIQQNESVTLWETKSELNNLMLTNQQGLLNYLESLENSDFDSVIAYQNTKGQPFKTSLKDILTHLFNHGTYHRGQIVQLLKAEREIVPSTDYIVFVRSSA